MNKKKYIAPLSSLRNANLTVLYAGDIFSGITNNLANPDGDGEGGPNPGGGLGYSNEGYEGEGGDDFLSKKREASGGQWDDLW